VTVLKLRLFFYVDNVVLVVHICGCFITNVSFIFIKLYIFTVL